MSKRPRAKSPAWLWVVPCALVAILAAHLFVPADFPAKFLAGATAVLSVNVCSQTSGGLDCGTPSPPPATGTGGTGTGGAPPPSRGGGGGGGGGGAPNVPPTIVPKTPIGSVNADINNDNRVDLADFSIMAYWFKRSLTPAAAYVDLSHDGRVDLVDFSIMAYYWKKQ